MHGDSGRSSTAEGVAALRAAGAREVDPVLRNPDHLAGQLIGWRYRARLSVPVLRRLALRLIDRQLPGIYLFVTARTKHFDAILDRELARGVGQVVVLGAGADSRAYRFARALSGATVYEVDHPATSAWKQRQVTRMLGAVPGHVRYVPVEFGTEPLDRALRSAGADDGLGTLFLWEGVTPYLAPEAVDDTLATVAGFADGSSVVFDYFYREALRNPERFPDGQRYLAYLAKLGEPLTFGLDPADVAGFLTERGFTVEGNAVPEDLAAQHLPGVGGHLLRCSGIVHARPRS